MSERKEQNELYHCLVALSPSLGPCLFPVLSHRNDVHVQKNKKQKECEIGPIRCVLSFTHHLLSIGEVPFKVSPISVFSFLPP